MSLLINVLYENGIKLPEPKIVSGDIKRYQNKDNTPTSRRDLAFTQPYLMIRDSKTGESLVPPLRNYGDIFMKDGGHVIIYRGVEITSDENGRQVRNLQEWEVDYCSDTEIFKNISSHTHGSKVTRDNDND